MAQAWREAGSKSGSKLARETDMRGKAFAVIVKIVGTRGAEGGSEGGTNAWHGSPVLEPTGCKRQGSSVVVCRVSMCEGTVLVLLVAGL